MRILYVADDLYEGFGGQARATQGHLAALAARGHEVTALAGREPHPSEPPPGVRVVRLPSLRLGNAQTRIAYPVIGTVAAEVARADILQANTPGPLTGAALLLARRKRVPVVLGVHTQIETSTLQLPRLAGVVAWALRRWYGWLFSRADLLVAPTAFAARTSRAFSAVRVEVVSNGVDFSSFARQIVPGDCAARGARLVYLGRLSAEKRPHDLLALMQELPERYSLTLAGSGPLADALAADIARRGLGERVRLAGRVDEAEKRRLLAEAAAFVMPSPAELQSIATLEAMASGCAVVAFDHASSAVPALVREAGAGVVVPAADPAAQAAAVLALVADAPGLCAARGRARAFAEAHDVSRSAERLEQLYLELVAANA